MGRINPLIPAYSRERQISDAYGRSGHEGLAEYRNKQMGFSAGGDEDLDTQQGGRKGGMKAG